MKIVSYLTLYFLAIASHAQTENPLAFYPLQIGNEWHYDVTGVYYYGELDTIYATQSYKVMGDTLMSNGKNYFVIERDRNDVQGRKYVDWFYLYVDSISTRIYIYEDDGTDGRIVDSLACSAGDFFLHSNHCESVNVDTILNYPTLTKYIAMDIPDLSLHHILAKDIGVVYEYESSGWGYDEYRTLFYAKVSGKEFGMIAATEEWMNKQTSFLLKQNYPNPFNPSTTINYELAKETKVNLRIFDILGREVATLVNETKPAGTYEAEFDGSNLTSGIYFYVLETGGMRLSKKMMLIK
jgi:hypothetical protein